MMSGSHHSGNALPAGRTVLPERVLEEIESHLRTREHRREELADRARKLRRLAQVAMTEVHAGTSTPTWFAEIRAETTKLAEFLRSDARGDEGLALDGLQEAVEALLLAAVVAHEPLPGPAELGVEPEPYLLGLGDLAGEVRRLALRALTVGDVDEAERYLGWLDGLLLTLLRFDAPRSIVAMKPKQDAARGIVERTRGDVALARALERARLPRGAPDA
jgi:translin